LLLWASLPARGQTVQTVYDDALQSGWQSYGWAQLNYAATATVHGGTKSIAVTAGAYEALYLHHDAQPAVVYTNLSFWIHGGTAGGQLLQVQATVNGNPLAPKALPALTKQWQQINLAPAALGLSNQTDFDGFWIQDRSGKAQPVFYVDDLRLIGPTPTPPATVVVTVDAQRDRHGIRPEVYGVAFASEAAVRDLNLPLNRSGGNAETRYNWQLNAHNHAADFYFESIADTGTAPGQATDSFIADSRNGGAQPMITVPTIGWAAKLGPNRGKLASFSIRKYGAQTGNDAAYFADAGNGIKSDGPPKVYVTGNDPNDASVPADTAFQDGWLQHLITKWGSAANGGIRYYLLDNEPSIWHSSHRDIHPVGASLDELRDKTLAYAAMIKAREPGAVVFGPEEWGWSGYFYSGYDQQYGGAHNYSSYPDRAAHGNQDYIPWLLDQWRQTNALTGKRLIDVLSVHFYPQGGEFGDDVSAGMQLRRNRSTRSLWDTNYVDQTWINAVVKLVPRLREWVAAHYPGTSIALTEYSWGADGHISGATAQADVLGILGRENIDFATRWTCPATGKPAYNAIKLYRNYDGNRSAFGDVSVAAAVPNPDEVAAFAAERSADGALTLMVINKAPDGPRTVTLNVTNFVAATAQVWRLDSANAIQHLPDLTFSGGSYTGSFPAQSITLLVLPPAKNLKLRARAATSDTFTLEVSGTAGSRYRLDATGDLANWLPVTTNVLKADPDVVALPVPFAKAGFIRGEPLP
jgi:hypothetical protein